MKFANLSPTALEKIKAARWDRIIEKHEGPERWEWVLEYHNLEYSFSKIRPMMTTRFSRALSLSAIALRMKTFFSPLSITNGSSSNRLKVQTVDWIQTRTVTNRTVIEALADELDKGEAEAIALALELGASHQLADKLRIPAFIKVSA